jgi:hypothetical protein
VSIPFILLIAMLGLTPITLFADGPVERAIAAAVAAIAAAMVALFMRPGEGSYLANQCRPWLAVIAVPAIFMVVQALPIPILAHPIWASAAEGLGVPMMGAISIDPGLTVIVLGRYLFAVAVAFVAMAVTIDRGRAQTALLVLVGVTAAVAIAELWVPVTGPAVATIHAMTALGVIIAMAATIHVAERLELHRDRSREQRIKYFAAIAGGSIAFLLGAWTLLLRSPRPVVFAAACGVGLMAITAAARRFAVGPRITLAGVATALVFAVIIAANGSNGDADLSFRFALSGPTEVVSRMIADIPALGGGAGTYAALLPIYGGISDLLTVTPPPTAAVAITIGLGRPMFLVSLLVALVFAASLQWGAMSRGRDWVYPAAAAALVVVVTIEAFLDATLFDSAVLMIVVAMIGLGLAQRVGRGAR